jgi:hypothetical protein
MRGMREEEGGMGRGGKDKEWGGWFEGWELDVTEDLHNWNDADEFDSLADDPQLYWCGIYNVKNQEVLQADWNRDQKEGKQGFQKQGQGAGCRVATCVDSVENR